MKLIKEILSDVDLRKGLIWYVLLTIVFGLVVLPMPTGYGLLIAFAVAGLSAILPDLDKIPYQLIRKDKPYSLLVLGTANTVVCGTLAFELGKPAFLWLGLAGILGVYTAAIMAHKAVERASHWPIWHHPIPVLVICAGLVWSFTHDFAPQQVWYYELLVLVNLGRHFMREGLQRQGFPFFSPFSDTHYWWDGGLSFKKVSKACAHYHYLAKAAGIEFRTDAQISGAATS